MTHSRALLAEGSNFSKVFFDNLDANLGFNQAFSTIEPKQLKHPQFDRIQSPVQYGPNVPNLLDKPKTGSNNGVAILVEGKYRHPGDSISFSRDMERAKSTYEKLGFTVLPAHSFNEYEQAFKKAAEIGEKNPNDMLIVQYTGHGSIIKDKAVDQKEQEARDERNKETSLNARRGEEIELEPAGVTPIPKHNPNDTSVLFFNKEGGNKNNYGLEPDKANLVHEADVTRPIFSAAREGHFDHVLSIWDACGAGAVDHKQYSNSEEKNIEVDPKQLHKFGR